MPLPLSGRPLLMQSIDYDPVAPTDAGATRTPDDLFEGVPE